MTVAVPEPKLAEVYFDSADFTLYLGDVRHAIAQIPDESIDCVVTSPPYWGLRDYGFAGQIGLEPTPAAYVAELVAVFRQIRRVLAPHGTAWINVGDSFNNRSVGRQSSHQGGLGFESDDLAKSWADLTAEGRTRLSINDGELKEKDLVGVPWALAFALRAGWSRCSGCELELRTDLWPVWNGHRVCVDCLTAGRESTVERSEFGWYLRAGVVWAKPNGMPESMEDRPTRSHELVFMLAKNERYYFGQDDVREPHTHDGRRVTTIQAGRDSIQHRDGERWPNPDGKNIRDVWTISPQPYKGAHFAVMPEELARRCILAGTPEHVCRICGTPRRDEATCGCLPDGSELFERDALELIETPLGEGTGRTGIDPTPETGRRGLGRPRADDAGVRPITRFEQRRYARQLKASPHRAEMEAAAGDAFAHYVRTDRAGARPIPPELLAAWLAAGWLEPVAPPDVAAADWPGKWRPGRVLDPFMGSGTTAKVARGNGRHAVGVEGKEAYARLCVARNAQMTIFTEEDG